MVSEFNLRIIRTYGAAGHGKVASKMCYGKILLLTTFFSTKVKKLYLEIKCPHFSYTHLPTDDVVKSRIKNNESIIIKDCMKQYLMDQYCVKSICVGAVHVWNSTSKNAWETSLVIPNYHASIIMVTMKKMLSIRRSRFFVSLFNGSQNEPLYLVQVTEKGTAEKDLTDRYGHFIGTGENLLIRYYLKQCRSKQISKKKFQILSTPIVFAPDEIFDTYVDITDDLYLDVQSFSF